MLQIFKGKIYLCAVSCRHLKLSAVSAVTAVIAQFIVILPKLRLLLFTGKALCGNLKLPGTGQHHFFFLSRFTHKNFFRKLLTHKYHNRIKSIQGKCQFGTAVFHTDVIHCKQNCFHRVINTDLLAACTQIGSHLIRIPGNIGDKVKIAVFQFPMNTAYTVFTAGNHNVGHKLL